MGKCKIPIIGGGNNALIPYGFNEVEGVTALQHLEPIQLCKIATNGARKTTVQSFGTKITTNARKIKDDNGVYLTYSYRTGSNYSNGAVSTTFYYHNLSSNAEVSVSTDTLVSFTRSDAYADYIVPFQVSDTVMLYICISSSQCIANIIEHRYNTSNNSISELATEVFGLTAPTGSGSGVPKIDIFSYDEINDIAYVRVELGYRFKGTTWYSYTLLKVVGVQRASTLEVTYRYAGGDYDYADSPAASAYHIMTLTGQNAGKSLIMCNGGTYIIDLSVADVYNIISGATRIDSLSIVLRSTVEPWPIPTSKTISSNRKVIIGKSAALFNSDTGKLIKSTSMPIIGSEEFTNLSYYIVLNTPGDTFMLISDSSYNILRCTPSTITLERGDVGVSDIDHFCRVYSALPNGKFKISIYGYSCFDIILGMVAYLSSSPWVGLGTVYDAINGGKVVEQYDVCTVYANTPTPLTAYGISATMLSTIKDDTIQEVQNELNS